MTRLYFERHVGAMLDHPSVYMGGASPGSLRKAASIADLLIENGIAFEEPETKKDAE